MNPFIAPHTTAESVSLSFDLNTKSETANSEKYRRINPFLIHWWDFFLVKSHFSLLNMLIVNKQSHVIIPILLKALGGNQVTDSNNQQWVARDNGLSLKICLFTSTKFDYFSDLSVLVCYFRFCNFLGLQYYFSLTSTSSHSLISNSQRRWHPTAKKRRNCDARKKRIQDGQNNWMAEREGLPRRNIPSKKH